MLRNNVLKYNLINSSKSISCLHSLISDVKNMILYINVVVGKVKNNCPNHNRICELRFVICIVKYLNSPQDMCLKFFLVVCNTHYFMVMLFILTEFQIKPLLENG